MAARFYAITKDEIHEFLTGLGFQPLALRGVVELVYAKIVVVGNHRLFLRCYTAVNPNGESRERGTDAIRVLLFMKVRNGGKEEIIPVGKAQKCLRDASWRENLAKAIQRHAAPENFRVCPACGHPMVLRHNKASGDEFWGCSMFKVTGCKGRQAPQPARSKTPLLPEASEELAPWEQDDLQNRRQS